MAAFTEGGFEVPAGASNWNDDVQFGRLRLQGINNSLIRLVTDAKPLPSNFPVTDELVGAFLEGKTLQKAILAKRVFMTDLGIVARGSHRADRALCAPLALYYQNDQQQLLLSHPVYKLLAPHFLYLIALDNLAKSTLINPGGVFDKGMSAGRDGMLQIAGVALEQWRLDTDGNLPADLKRRGLEDDKVLANYHFRDDAILFWRAISEYVHQYVALYYPDTQTLTQDRELQNWAAELVKKQSLNGGGLGMKGVPGNGEIRSTSDLAAICTSVIYTASVSHAAANFPQYDTYAFIPNYPGQLLGNPPTSRDTSVSDQD